MRKLSFKDVMTVARIMKKAKLKEEFARITAKSQEKDVKIESLGIDALMTVFEACGEPEVEQEVYRLLDDIFEVNSANLSLESLIEKFKQLIQENDLNSFFKSASQLTH